MNITKALKNIKQIPKTTAVEEIACIRENREAAIPVLLERVKAVTDAAGGLPANHEEHFYAMYLLAEFGVNEALPHLIKYLEFDEYLTNMLLGDALTEDFPSILATLTTADDIIQIKEIIENPTLNCFNRAVAAHVLKILYIHDRMSRNDYHSYIKHLLSTCNDNDDPEFIGFLICDCEEAGFSDLLPIIKKLYDAKLVETQIISYSEVKAGLRQSTEASALDIMKDDDTYSLIKDSIEWLDHRGSFCSDDDDDDDDFDDLFDSFLKFNELAEILRVEDSDDSSESTELYIQNSMIAERRKPQYTLSDALPLQKVTELKEIAKYNNIDGYSSMKKADLISHLIDIASDPYILKMHLLRLTEKEWAFFKRAVAAEHILDELSYAEDFFRLSILCLLLVYYHDEHLYYVVPQETKQAFFELEKKGFSAEKDHADNLNKYALAVTNLYGIMTINDFVKLFNEQNQHKTDAAEVASILHRYISLYGYYELEGDYLINHEFEDDEQEEIQHFVDIAASYPRYLPEKHDLLKYADSNYIEDTPQLQKLRLFVKESVVKDEAVAELLIIDLYFAAYSQSDKKEYKSILKNHNIALLSSKLKTLLDLLGDLSANIRLGLIGGHTLHELAGMNGTPHNKKPITNIDDYRFLQKDRLDSSDRDNIWPAKNEPVRVTKIGRNEPCPCNSGKKYKKCCGS